MTTKGVPYSWEISQPDGNDEGTDISRYSSLGAPDVECLQTEWAARVCYYHQKAARDSISHSKPLEGGV